MSNKVTITGISTSNLPKLTAKESKEMLCAIKQGNELLREEFLKANIRLVLSMVQRFHDIKESPDDLFQVGMIGLIKAVDNFDTSLNVRFSTYAVPMILGEIKRYLREGTTMKVGRNLRDIAYRAIQARQKIELEFDREASLTEIAAEIDIPYRDVVSALDAISEPVSIYDSVYSDGEDSIMILEQLPDPKSNVEYLDILTLKDGLKSLPNRERDVLELRYYQGRTQMEISRELDISQAQVSRLEKTALDRLRTAF